LIIDATKRLVVYGPAIGRLLRGDTFAMESILNIFSSQPEIDSLAEGFAKGIEEQMATGLAGSSRSLLLASLRRKTGRPLCVITHNMLQAQKVHEDLSELLPEEEVLLYPANETVMTELLSVDRGVMKARIHVMDRLVTGQAQVLVLPYSGWRRLLPPAEQWKEKQFVLTRGQEVKMESVIGRLVDLGYERVERVEEPGQFGVRGGIIDVFPLHEENPVRIEWFDVEIDSLRAFDPETQRSLENRDHLRILPVDEWGATLDERHRGAQQIQQFLQSYLRRIGDVGQRERVSQQVQLEVEKLKAGEPFDSRRKYTSAIFPGYENLLRYMPEDTLVVFDEPSRIFEIARQMEKDEAEAASLLLEEGKLLPQLKLSFSLAELRQRIQGPVLYLSTFLRQLADAQPGNVVHFMSKTMQNFHGQMKLLKSEVERWLKARFHVVFLASNEERSRHLARVLADEGIEASRVSRDTPALSPKPAIMEANLHSGFELVTMRLVVITEQEVFTKLQRSVRRPKVMNNAERIKSYQELKVGDYVVHVNHGIGRYMGIETLSVGGVHKDYLHIKYAGNDKLYVPIDQIDLVQKYIGADEKEPKIYSLGGNEWSRVKSRVRSAVKDIAEDLVKLYAQRQAMPGYAFSPDTEYQREFEALFPYEETPDQLRAVEEIKRDMEQPRPMDRLLCGDVGYGKTEVAIRAAFKAVMDHKQVAVLVPTTILAQQHFETFRGRFSGYPVRIEVLSRFRSRQEQAKVIRGLKDGTVDIVIGTHRLLSKDIQFRDLGLLIVDEEQRFGVSHKEKLKRLKANVDVLTLTATPIPRTLHMSLLGVRDLSIIETPPENRFPVQTYVVEYSSSLVREAIERELARGGQVFFLYNRIQGIEKMAEEIASLVPDARVAIAHGQLPERQLEETMFRFMEGEFDVLVSTTIIETGVDFPNVNTLIIYEADKMGLSQLYQLRGRVGRSSRIAYAYFTYLPDKVLSEEAEKRLQAIREFTDLGSGFKIAMRDLSIRGAGNLLGPEQHGFIASVGFDLYSQMLSEAIKQLREGEETKQEPAPPQVELQVDAYLPSEYIPDSSQKIEMYKRFTAIRKIEDVEELMDECLDRFGAWPPPVERLFAIARIKVYAWMYGVQTIREEGEDWVLEFSPEAVQRLDGQKLFQFVSQYPRQVRLMAGTKVGIKMNVKGVDIQEALKTLESLVKGFGGVFKDLNSSDETNPYVVHK
jgi:transcription-repair coupling factor (superfamily II helicase)